MFLLMHENCNFKQHYLKENFRKFSHCRIGIDEWLRVPSVQDIFSIGDCCGFVESTGKPTLPALAQVTYIGFISFSNSLSFLEFFRYKLFLYLKNIK